MDGTETYIFAGGGSGGHLFPGIAVAEELRRRNPAARILFVGSERPVEQLILKATPYEHHGLPIESWSALRRNPWRFCWRAAASLRSAYQILQATRAKAVVGLGGFASAPTVWAAARMGLPVLLIEQNVIPGAATRWLAGCAGSICLWFEATRDRLPRGVSTVVTGNPVRPEILRAAADRRAHGMRAECRTKTLLILGGSQGAESLNLAVRQLISDCRSALADWQIVHQTGAGRAAEIREYYAGLGVRAVVADFFPHIADWYAEAELVISRAGATTLAELACVGCPSILIPYPFAADQHQAANAEIFQQRGASVMISQQTNPVKTAAQLRVPLMSLLSDPERRTTMSGAALQLARPDAAAHIADLLEQEICRANPHQNVVPATSERTLKPSPKELVQ